LKLKIWSGPGRDLIGVYMIKKFHDIFYGFQVILLTRVVSFKKGGYLKNKYITSQKLHLKIIKKRPIIVTHILIKLKLKDYLMIQAAISSNCETNESLSFVKDWSDVPRKVHMGLLFQYRKFVINNRTYNFI
jgi:hypothetical protein